MGFLRFVATGLLMFGFATPTIAPYTGVYIALGAMLFGFFMPLFNRSSAGGVNTGPGGSRVARILFFAFLLLLVPLPFHWHGPTDLLPPLIGLAILLALGVAHLTVRYDDIFNIGYVAGASLLGCFAGVGMGLFEVFALGEFRVSATNNPIHYGALSVILGFLATAGVFSGKSPWRFVFISGFFLAWVAVILSGSRGPALAAFGLTLVLMIFLVLRFWKRTWFWVSAVALAIGFSSVLLWLFGDSQQMLRIADTYASTAGFFIHPFDIAGTNAERMAMLVGAIGAFMHAPIVGYGYTGMGQAVVPYVPQEWASIGNYEHLHADISDFAVSSGALGLLAFLAYLVSPIAAVWHLKDHEQRLALFYVASILVVGYALMGLTNAVFGILPQTVLYAATLGVLVGLGARQSR